MRIIVAGSRGFADYKLLAETLDRLTANLKEIIILSGHAKGADILGEQWCFERGYKYLVYHADWGKHKKAAGMVRNAEMVGAADALICFWDGVSKGSESVIEMAKKKGLKVRVIRYKKLER